MRRARPQKRRHSLCAGLSRRGRKSAAAPLPKIKSTISCAFSPCLRRSRCLRSASQSARASFCAHRAPFPPSSRLRSACSPLPPLSCSSSLRANCLSPHGCAGTTERLSSTEEGAQLEELEERLACLALVLDGAPEQDAEDEENQDEDPDETSDASPDEDADEN